MHSIATNRGMRFLLAALLAVSVAGAGMAADAVDEIDTELQDTAGQLNRELDQATRQIHESERLGTPSSVANQYGSASSIDQEISRTVDTANEELRRAKIRDDYTEKRRELETTRSLYYPNSKEYNQFTEQIQKLDNDFAQSARR